MEEPIRDSHVSESTVFLVDDDDELRMSITTSLTRAGFRVESFASAESFLAEFTPHRVGCIVLDYRLPGGLSGTQLQDTLRSRGWRIPVILLSGHFEERVSVAAARKGALCCLSKPVKFEVLKRHILSAFEQSQELDRKRRDTLLWQKAMRVRFERLTSQERSILASLVAGESTYDVAKKQGIGHWAVAFHRAKIMQRMEASSLRELTAFAIKADVLDGLIDNCC